MSGESRRMPPLKAGRRPAGLALLQWLEDTRAPRLCLVTGSAGAGRSHLLEWLALGCATERAPEPQRVHAVLPGAGWTLRAAVWSLGRQLAMAARTPEELLAALAEDERRAVICIPRLGQAADPARLVAELLDPLLKLEQLRLIVEAPQGVGFTAVADPAVLDLDQPQWTDQERFTAWCGREGANPAGYPNPGAALGRTGEAEPETVETLIGRVPRDSEGTPDLVAAGGELLGELWRAGAREGMLDMMIPDTVLLAHAGPVAVTAVLEGRTEAVAAAWEAAGPALIDEPDPTVRAAVLHTRLIGMDDEAATRLAAVPATWRGTWAMWPNSSLGWPGPVASLAVGAGPYAGQLLLTDPAGIVRTVDAATGRPLARVPVTAPKPLRGLTVTPGGSVLLLDSQGEIAVVGDGEPLDGPLAALRAGADAALSAVVAVSELPGAAPAVGDEAGAVHWYQDGSVLTRRLHAGPVTALAGVAQEGGPALISGGFDGAVRLWRPGSEPTVEPFDRRDREVNAVTLAIGENGMTAAAAWADGLVRVWRPGNDPDGVLELRLGSQVWALGLADGLLILGTADGIAAIRV